MRQKAKLENILRKQKFQNLLNRYDYAISQAMQSHTHELMSAYELAKQRCNAVNKTADSVKHPYRNRIEYLNYKFEYLSERVQRVVECRKQLAKNQ